MQKSTLLLFIGLLISLGAMGQTSQADSVNGYFTEIKTATAKHKSMWNKDIYGRILLVDKNLGLAYANFQDSLGVLAKQRNIYSTTVLGDLKLQPGLQKWNGNKWVVVMIPLPKKDKDRIALITRDLYKLAAPSMDLKLPKPDNSHMANKDARVYLRLELEALKKAVLASDTEETRKHLTNALIFRKNRYILFPEAPSQENTLEINDGLAHYTALVMSGRKEIEITPYLVSQLNSFLTERNFEHDFASQTVPMYGVLFQRVKKEWTRDIKTGTNLNNYFSSGFGLKMPADVKVVSKRVFALYNGPAIEADESRQVSNAH